MSENFYIYFFSKYYAEYKLFFFKLQVLLLLVNLFADLINDKYIYSTEVTNERALILKISLFFIPLKITFFLHSFKVVHIT